MAFAGMIAEEITVRGYNGDEIEAYYARPMGIGPFPCVTVIHHMPGWDEWSKEVVRKFAYNGYAAVGPHLFSRLGPGSPDDLSAKCRAEGGLDDAYVMGDVQAAMEFIRQQPIGNGKMGVIGFCSGGRHTYL